jgi:hypothetical protein
MNSTIERELEQAYRDELEPQAVCQYPYDNNYICGRSDGFHDDEVLGHKFQSPRSEQAEEGGRVNQPVTATQQAVEQSETLYEQISDEAKRGLSLFLEEVAEQVRRSPTVDDDSGSIICDRHLEESVDIQGCIACEVARRAQPPIAVDSVRKQTAEGLALLMNNADSSWLDQRVQPGNLSTNTRRATLASALKLLAGIVVLLALPLLAYGQEPTVRAMKVFDKQEPTKALRQTKTPGAYVLVPIKTEHWYAGLDLALDATWVGVAIGDRLSTNYALSHCPRCYETSPVQSSNARTAISFALIGVTDWVQHEYPEKRTVIRLFKLVPIGIETFAIVHNRGLVKR